MKKYYLSFILLSLQASATDPLGELINRLDSVNDISCEEMSQEELAQHCQREVCGPPGNKSSNITAKNASKFLTVDQEKEFQKIEQQVKKLFNQRKKETQDFINELKKRANNPNFNKTQDWDEYDYSYFSNFLWKYLDWQVDSTKPYQERSKIIVNESLIDPSLLEGAKDFAKQFNKNLYNDPIYSFEMGIINADELKKAVIEKANQAKEKLSTKVNFKEFQSQIQSSSDPQKIIASFKELEDKTMDHGVQLISNESNCQEECKKSISNFVKKLNPKTIVNNLESSHNYNDVEDTLAQCRAHFIVTNQQNNLKDNFSKMWPEVKSAFHKNVLPHFSTHSREIMKEYLASGVHFYFENPTFESFPDLSEMPRKEDQITFKDQSNGFLLGDLMNNHFDPDIGLYQADITLCQPNSSPSLIWDNYMSKEALQRSPSYQRPYHNIKKDNISVSPFTCEHNQEGAGILAHELGHAFSNLMNRSDMSTNSLKDYRTIRSCASQQWDINQPSEHPHHPNDKQFTEEDTADIISYMAINDGKSLYACGFMNVSHDGSSYTDSDTEPWGVHSPGLVRLMRELSYKRKDSLPKTCSTLMTRHQDKLGDQKCF